MEASSMIDKLLGTVGGQQGYSGHQLPAAQCASQASRLGVGMWLASDRGRGD